jgi:predicted nucleotidyltransferase
MLGAGESFVNEAKKISGVGAIIFIGGLARGTMDHFSDMDILVLTDGKGMHVEEAIKPLVERIVMEGHEIDVEIHSFSDLAEREWDEIKRWDFSNCRIVHDPTGKATAMISDKTRMREDDWRDRVVMASVLLSWYSFPEGNHPSLARMWLERGDPLSAHHCIDHSMQVVIDLLFTLNRRFIPPAKWKMQQLFSLPWLPNGLYEAISGAMLIKDLGEDELRRRERSLETIRARLEEMEEEFLKMTREEMTSYYLERLM